MKIAPANVVLNIWNARSPDPGSTYPYAGLVRAQSTANICSPVNETVTAVHKCRKTRLLNKECIFKDMLLF